MALLIIAVSVGATIFIYQYFVYPVFLSPLSKIPNAHSTCSFSSTWILWKRYRANENKAIHLAHQRYGDIVRLGPRELSINCVEGGIKTVYSGGFEKHDWYSDVFDNYGIPPMFATTASKPHSVRKRMVSNVYSKTYLQSSPEMRTISETILFDRFLPIFEAAAQERTAIDVYSLNFAAAADFISAYLFGLADGTKLLQDDEARRSWLALYQSKKSHGMWDQELPGISSIVRKIGFRLVPREVDAATEKLEAWCLKMCEGASKRQDTSIPEETDSNVRSSKALVFNHLSHRLTASAAKDSTPALGHSPAHVVASEMVDELGAGQETGSIALTYIYHELSQSPSLQKKLRDELLALEPPTVYPRPQQRIHDSPQLPSPRSLDGLPILHAIVLETLRLHPPAPGPQPRVTPIQPTTLAGYANIPAGIRVSAQAYSLHRNAKVFPEPEAWKPERWLDACREEKEEMMRWFWAFSSGSRMCIGSHFAMQEMKLLVAAIYTNYTTSIVDDSGIEDIDGYIGGPKAERLLLRFERA